MPGDGVRFDHLFVSDLHLAMGYDRVRKAYHAREDFFFDAAFFRWLRWADRQCAADRRWELVCVGDTFDFLPVDRQVLDAFFDERARREQESVLGYWRQCFAQPPGDPVLERVQHILFEEDVLNRRVELTSRREDAVYISDVMPALAPAWAARIDAALRPGAQAERETRYLASPADYAYATFVTPPRRPTAAVDPAFERRYGFLPTPVKSADKVTSIYQGHPVFFRALAWFVGRGHRVAFVRGNHDLELFWPLVQERIREHILAELDAAFESELESPARDGFEERISFPGWFYYRRGLFFAEHGKQHEPLNACPNPIRPVLPGDEQVLNPPVGELGVITFHNHLEDRFPDWENRGDHAVVLLDLWRKYPLKMTSMLVRHGITFMHMAQRLWLAGEKGDQGPTEQDLKQKAAQTGLPKEVVKGVYDAGDTPLLMRRGLAWLLFSPAGHVIKGILLLALFGLLVTGVLAWYLLLAPALAALVPGDLPYAVLSPALQLLVQILVWLIPPVMVEVVRRKMERRYPASFLRRAMERVHHHLGPVDPELGLYVTGHDHRPDTYILEQRADGRPVHYMNTGSWTPWFAEGKRRLQSLGRDVEFTFVRLVERDDGYQADLLRWNDDAERADQQLVPPVDW